MDNSFTRGLLGMFQPQPDPYQSLLGDYYNPQQARMAWLGGTLQGVGAGLASGKAGAWAQGAALGGGEGLDNYRQRAVMANALAMRKQDQEWQNKAHTRQEKEWASEDATSAQVSGLINSIQNPQERLWAQMDPKGYFSNKYGQHESKAPSSVQEYEYAKSQGFTGSYMDWKKQGGGGLSLGIDPATGQLTLMAGGSGGGSNGSIPAEIGSRIGMGEQFLQTDVPAIEPGIKAGDATGPIDYVQGVFGRGNAGNIHRRMASGADALRRGLTGAGMSGTESSEYANRYLPTWSDDADTLEAKLKSLEADLNAVKNGALAGKTGNLAAFLPGSQIFATPQPSAPAATNSSAAPKTGDIVDDASAIPEGAVVQDQTGQHYKKINGQLQKVQ